MPKVIDIPNYGTVEFPDSMSDDAISNVIRTQVMRAPEYVQKQKAAIGQQYDSIANAQQPAPQSNGVMDFAKGLFGGVADMVKHYGYDLPMQASEDINQRVAAGDYSGALAAAFKHGVALGSTPLVAAKDMAAAQVEQGKQAVRAGQEGRYSEEFGHGLAAVTPGVGPAAAQAGEDIGSGQYAKGAGEVAALLTPEVAARVGGAATKSAPVRTAAENAVDKLVGSSEKDWYTALNPTTKANKALTQNKVAPGLADRGIVATSLKDLREQAAAKLAEHGENIDDFMAQRGNDTVPAAPILRDLDALKAGKSRNGITPSVNQPYIESLDNIRNEIQQMAKANGGNLTLNDIRWLRQQYDATAAAKNAFALAPAEQSRLAGLTDGTNTMRGRIADMYPELAAENKEYSFWSDVDKVAGETQTRRVGQRGPLTEKLAQGAGAAVGAKAAGPAGAVIGSEIGGKLARLRNSVVWRSISAETKNRIADLLDSGNAQQAWQLANRAALAATVSGRGAALVNAPSR